MIVVIANSFALVHAARNRADGHGTEITLSNRELRYFPSFADDNSGVTLALQWRDPNGFALPNQLERPSYWLDQQKLQMLGFDCSVNPASSEASRFYQRQRPRQAFLALEYDGPAWQAWMERAKTQPKNAINDTLDGSRLVAIDADLNPAKLRSRHLDGGTVLILPAVIAVMLDPFPYRGTERAVQIRGYIQQVPSTIHVPRPFSEELRRLDRRPRDEVFNKSLLYRIHLRYGSSFEPWVTGVEFPNAQ